MVRKPARRTKRSATSSLSAKSSSTRQKKSRTRSQASRKKSSFLIKLPKIPRLHWDDISPGRKLDLLGIFLTLVGLFTLIGLLFPTTSGPIDFWIEALYKIFGWGIYIFPLAVVGFGLWLIFRRVENFPALTFERLIGLILIYLNLLTWLHHILKGGWELAQNGQGGGYIGSTFSLAMNATLGPPGTSILLVAWLLVSLSMSLDLSVSDLLARLFSILYPITHPLHQAWAAQVAPRLGMKSQADTWGEDGPFALPPDFHPLQPGFSKKRNRMQGKTGSNGLSDLSGPDGEPVTKGDISRISTPNGFPDLPISATTKAAMSAWVMPSVEAILDPPSPVAIQSNIDQERARIIEESLSSFGAPGHVVEIHHGPTITQYGVEPDFIEGRSGKTRVRVSRIASLADDLALALAASRIRIQAPVPGRSYVGIEVPNPEISLVALREILDSEDFKNNPSILRFGLGKDVAGNPRTGDLKAMPHMLIAGTTGSGKSVCINAILCSFLLFNSPADLRLMLVDPKRVELNAYNGIPHLLTPVVVDPERVIGALQWMMREMDSRYQKFTRTKVRNIQEYNQQQQDEYIPHIVIVIDELADLMMLAREETERCITRLAQLARATGIHLIIATQRPSVDVITGLIKANFPARIAFAVASGIDSRVILDTPGAERLLGRGDMLFQPPDTPSPIRLQGPYVSDSEIQLLVDYWRFNALPPDQMPLTSSMNGREITLPQGVPLQQIPLWKEENGDPLLAEAIDLARREGRASITMLQRRLRIGYTRAARLVDSMEDQGIIGPPRHDSQVREILDYGESGPPAEEV